MNIIVNGSPSHLKSLLDNYSFYLHFLKPIPVKLLQLFNLFVFFLSAFFLFFLTPFFSAAVMLVDQCWDLLYLLHISSAAPFSPPPHLFSTFFFFLPSRPLIMLLLCLYSLFTSSLHGMKLLIWLEPEQGELQVWAEVREGHRHKYTCSNSYIRTVHVCLCACKQRYKACGRFKMLELLYN